MRLPHGWTDQYALGWLLEQHAQQAKALEAMNSRVAELEAEVARLDVQKANRAGRKSKPLSGDERQTLS